MRYISKELDQFYVENRLADESFDDFVCRKLSVFKKPKITDLIRGLKVGETYSFERGAYKYWSVTCTFNRLNKEAGFDKFKMTWNNQAMYVTRLKE